jgi:hypothetical protein
LARRPASSCGNSGAAQSGAKAFDGALRKQQPVEAIARRRFRLGVRQHMRRQSPGGDQKTFRQWRVEIVSDKRDNAFDAVIEFERVETRADCPAMQ